MLAVSGGLDSMTLLDAAVEVCDPSRLIVATFDHGTGRAATAARALVERVARDRGIECVVGKMPRGTARRTEAAWREARWAFLRETARVRGGGAMVATAHTADDQVETVLMRTLRGAGARGLSGLLAPTDVLRPLVGLRRATLLECALERGLAWVDDPTNQSRRFFRNRIRHDILPALRRANGDIDRELLALGERAAAWRRETESLARDVSTVDRDANAVDIATHVTERLEIAHLAVLWPAVAARIGVTLDGRGIRRLAAFSRDSRVGSRIQLSGGWEVIRSRHALRLRTSEQDGASEMQLNTSTPTTWGDWRFWVGDSAAATPARDESSGWNARLQVDQPLTVRGWLPGDRLPGASGGPGRKVKRLLNDAGVTGHERTGWPVVLCGDQIVWIPGVRRSGAAANRSGGGLGRTTLTFICARHIG